MKLNSLKSVYPLVKTLYNVTIDEHLFEDIALIGWQLIGNKYTRLYRYVGDTHNRVLQLPCNVDMIESVTCGGEDVARTSVLSDHLTGNQIIESRNEAFKTDPHPLYQPGKLLTYREIDGGLEFAREYNNVSVLYHGIIVDDEGLPLINDKEILALATYVAYTDMYRKGIGTKNGEFLQLAQVLKADWLRMCNDARVPEYMSQNEINDILDVHTRWDRKQYGRSKKPFN